jgi:hypothetical protein
MVYAYTERFERLPNAEGPIHSSFFTGCESLRSKYPWPEAKPAQFHEQSLHFLRKRVQSRPDSAVKQPVDRNTWIFVLLLLMIACVSVCTLILLMRPNEESSSESLVQSATEDTKGARLGSQELAVSHASSISSRIGSMEAAPSWLRHNQRHRHSVEDHEERLALMTVHSKQALLNELNSQSQELSYEASQDDRSPPSDLPARLHRTRKSNHIVLD